MLFHPNGFSVPVSQANRGLAGRGTQPLLGARRTPTQTGARGVLIPSTRSTAERDRSYPPRRTRPVTTTSMDVGASSSLPTGPLPKLPWTAQMQTPRPGGLLYRSRCIVRLRRSLCVFLLAVAPGPGQAPLVGHV